MALSDLDPDVREAAAEALGELIANNSNSDFRTLKLMANNLAFRLYDRDTQVRDAASAALEPTVARLTLRQVESDRTTLDGDW